MNVIFQTPSQEQNRFTMEVEGHGRIYFQKGAYITSDKELVAKLLQHPLKKRGEYKLKTNKERVAQYLEGDEPDKLTKEVLDSVTHDGVVEIGKACQATETQPVLLKHELVGEPITTEVQRLIDFYQREKSQKQATEENKNKEEVTEVETVTIPQSKAMKAKEAIAFIESAPLDELENFLSEDEDRVTVKEAYDNKVN